MEGNILLYIYAILTYILTGSLIYLMTRKRAFSKLSPFTNDILRVAGIIYKPVIVCLFAIDDYKDRKITKRLCKK